MALGRRLVRPVVPAVYAPCPASLAGPRPGYLQFGQWPPRTKTRNSVSARRVAWESARLALRTVPAEHKA